MKKYIVLFLVAVFINGCSTTYQKKGFTGGFSETRLGENIFRVSFKGNSYTSKERVLDFTLLRSAELAQENGFNYFIITNEKEGYNYTIGDDYIHSKPKSRNTIVCFKEKPKNKGVVYKAEFIIQSIKTKYEIK